MLAALLTAGCGATTTPGTVDLLETTSPHLVGATVDAWAGTSVADAGDVNGDGRPDVLVGAPRTNSSTLSQPGVRVRRLRGKRCVRSRSRRVGAARGSPSPELRRRITRARLVAAAGDVNGDGLADVAVGAPDAECRLRGLRTETRRNDRPWTPRAGRLPDRRRRRRRRDGLLRRVCRRRQRGRPARPARRRARRRRGLRRLRAGRAGTIDLRHLDGAGFRIAGAAADATGTSVSGLGDANGDGRPDLLIGAPNANGGAGSVFARLQPARPANDRPRATRQARRADRRRARGRRRRERPSPGRRRRRPSC